MHSNILVFSLASIVWPLPSITNPSTFIIIPFSYLDSSSSLKIISESKTISFTPLWINSSKYLKFLIFSFGVGSSITSSFTWVSSESSDFISSLSFSMLCVNVGSSITSSFTLFRDSSSFLDPNVFLTLSKKLILNTQQLILVYNYY